MKGGAGRATRSLHSLPALLRSSMPIMIRRLTRTPNTASETTAQKMSVTAPTPPLRSRH
jgi:hypothetical protein